jgi:hypothetical protein
VDHGSASWKKNGLLSRAGFTMYGYAARKALRSLARA